MARDRDRDSMQGSFDLDFLFLAGERYAWDGMGWAGWMCAWEERGGAWARLFGFFVSSFLSLLFVSLDFFGIVCKGFVLEDRWRRRECS